MVNGEVHVIIARLQAAGWKRIDIETHNKAGTSTEICLFPHEQHGTTQHMLTFVKHGENITDCYWIENNESRTLNTTDEILTTIGEMTHG